DGVDVLLFRTTDALKAYRPTRAVATQVANGGSLAYVKFLSWRGHVTPPPPPPPEPGRISAAGAAPRGGPEDPLPRSRRPASRARGPRPPTDAAPPPRRPRGRGRRAARRAPPPGGGGGGPARLSRARRARSPPAPPHRVRGGRLGGGRPPPGRPRGRRRGDAE